MIITIDTFLAAFFLGVLGAGHCLGMCGGIAAALSFALPSDKPRLKWMCLLAYNIGRILSYCLIGLLAGSVGWLLASWGAEWGAAKYLRIVAGALLILLGLYLANWWRILSHLERMGSLVWSLLKPVGDTLLPVKTPVQACLLGLVWGWLPCGLIYSALAFALASSNNQAITGGLIMLAFGVGTLPAVFLGGLAAAQIQSLLKNKKLRVVFALCYILFGSWTIFSAIQHANHNPESHQHH